MLIVVGLGNFGAEYVNTYHNCGYMTAALLAENLGFKFKKKACSSDIAEGFIKGEKVVIALPLTYMNNSGIAVKELLGYYKATVAELVVIYDDIDLPCGNLRIRQSGSAGTHNGMKSVIGEIKSQDFVRVRIGIGGKPEQMDLKDYVLMNVPKDVQPTLAETIKKAADGIKGYITVRDVEKFMREFSK